MKSMIALSVAALLMYASPAQAQSAPTCLESPSTPNCIEPAIASGNTAQAVPTFPNPLPACQNIQNSCPYTVAVPLANQIEWASFLNSAFLNQAGHCVTTSACGCPAQTYNAQPAGGVHLAFSVPAIAFGQTVGVQALNSGVSIPVQTLWLYNFTCTSAGTLSVTSGYEAVHPIVCYYRSGCNRNTSVWSSWIQKF